MTMPLGWQELPLNRITRMRSGDFISNDDIEPEGSYPVYGGNGLRGFSHQFNTIGPIVLVGRQGAHCGNVHVANGQIWVSEHALCCHPERELDAKWLAYALRDMNLNQYSVSAAQPGLSVDNLKHLRKAVPPLATQRRIARFLDEKTARTDGLIEKKRALLDRLAEKRQALITRAVTKGLNPDAPMKPSGIEWLGDIPAHWEVIRVKRIAVLESGHTPDRKIEAYWEHCDIPWVSLNDTEILRSGDYISDTTVKINAVGLINSSARMLPERAVVFTRDATIGESAITTRPMAVSQHIIAWLCVREKVVEEFLLMAIYGMKGELLRLTNGSTIGTIGLGDVKTISIALPPLSEQNEIVTAVFHGKSELERICRAIDRSIEQLSEYRAALITAAVTGQLDDLP